MKGPTASLCAKRAPILRGWIVGLLFSGALGAGAAYNIMVLHGSYMAIDFSAAGAIFLLFVWAFIVNGALYRLSPRLALTGSELRLAYVMALVACAIPTMGLTAQLLPIITSPFYFATPENGWAELIQPHIPPWTTPQGANVVRDFYEGSADGSVPLAAWVQPLLTWSVFLAALYVVSTAMMVIIRRQWMEHERLIYPLAQLPIEMTDRTDDRASSPLFRRPAMWAGFAVAFISGTLTGLNHYFPAVPFLAPQFASAPVFRNTEWLRFRLSFPMLGFFYLTHLDVAFSVWFFNLLSLAARGLMKMYNLRVVENLGIYGSRSPVFAHLGMGAMMTLVWVGLWTGRFHLRGVLRKAVDPSARVSDDDEILSYRAALLCILIGLPIMTLWLHATGIPLWATVAFLVAAFALFIGLTRVVAESGMAEAVATTIGSSFVVSSFGASSVGPPGVVGLSLTYVWAADIRTFVMASVANGLKTLEESGGRRRPVFWAMMSAVAVALLSSAAVMLTLAYRRGGINGNSWFFGGGAFAPYNYATSVILDQSGPNWLGWLFKGIGALAMGLLMLLRTRFLWFPLHPVGFAIGPIWIMDHIWMTVFLAWAIKWALLRWGGVRLYRGARPFFLGLILGQFVCNGVWLLIDVAVGGSGNSIFWI